MDNNGKSIATRPQVTEASELVKKQIAVAKDIALLSGNQLNQDEAMLLSSMYQSSYFKSVDSLSKAITRVVFGKMIGIDVATALTSLVIIDGKPSLEAKAIRNTLNMAGYSIVTKKLDDKECILDWSYKGEHLGESSFTMLDALRRGYVDPTCVELKDFPKVHNDRDVTVWKWDNQMGRKTKQTVKGCECKDNWRAMPQEMLVARATSKGNTQYGNKAFKQEVYETSELVESPFREDTTPVDVAKAAIEKATTIDELQVLTKELSPEELGQVLSLISEKTKELLNESARSSNKEADTDSGGSSAKK